MTKKVNSTVETIKFLYSYGGKIAPRPTDGVLRYVGGVNRVLAVDLSITLSELLIKFGESCGSTVILKCKLPTEDLDVLVSIKSDEELQIVIGEYKKVSPETKIRAVLFPVKSVKKVTPPSSPVSCFDFPSAAKPKKLPPRPPVNRNIPVKPVKKISPPSSPVSCFDFPSAPKMPQARPHSGERYIAPYPASNRYIAPVFVYPTTARSACSYESRRPMNFYNVPPHRNFTH